jgi:PAS domain S-box-containing protein
MDEKQWARSLTDEELIWQIEERDDFSTSLFDRCSDLILVYDCRFRITIFNSAAESFFGVSREQVRGKAVSEALLLLDEPQITRLKKVLQGEYGIGEIEQLRGPEKVGFFSMICAPLKDASSVIVGALLMCRENEKEKVVRES